MPGQKAYKTSSKLILFAFLLFASSIYLDTYELDSDSGD
jgi:hypothetical protein